MDKKSHPLGDNTVDLDILKVQSAPAARDVDFGQVLETNVTPALERKVLWKLDLLYACCSPSLQDASDKVDQSDTPDGILLHAPVHGQISPESSNIVQSGGRSGMLPPFLLPSIIS